MGWQEELFAKNIKNWKEVVMVCHAFLEEVIGKQGSIVILCVLT